MNEEKEIEELAQIFANKRHSSIEWGRECAKIAIEAGYTRFPKPEVVSEDTIGFIAFKIITGYGEESAKEQWTGKHYRNIDKITASNIATSIHHLLEGRKG